MKNDRLRRFVRKIVKESFDKEDWTHKENVFTYLVRKGVDPFEFGMWALQIDLSKFNDSYTKKRLENEIEIALRFVYGFGKNYTVSNEFRDPGFYITTDYLHKKDYKYAFVLFQNIVDTSFGGLGLDKMIDRYKKSPTYKARYLQ